ncbi:MAG TPA: hypothetical protein VFQ65_08100 [Kofleriaceae bacterium]|nr:hypothetical protein [Kofleriaceae bacterium]
MRSSLALLFVFGAAGVASAQPSETLVLAPPAPSATSGMWLDFGVGATRVDPGDGNTYRGSYVRFAPQTTINRMFYLGAEIDIGSFDMSQPSAGNTAARGGSSGTGTTMSNGDSGALAAAKLVAGARLMAGAFSGGLELASGVRYTTVTGETGLTGVSEGRGVVEARGRLDVWVTPHLTIGALAGSDIVRRDEATFALNVGFHFEPFDHTRY